MVLLALADEVAVDLVGQHHHPVFQADLTDPEHVLRAPAVARGVLRVAEDERVGVDADLLLELLEVHRVLAVDDLERHFLGDGLAGGEVAVEAVVGGRLQQHLRALGREGLERGDESGVHAHRHHRLGRLEGDAVAPLVPRGHVLEEGSRQIEVAPVLVLQPLLQRLGDRRRGAEVHVGDAHADLDAALPVDPNLLVILHRIGAETVVRRVEVVLSVRTRRKGLVRGRSGGGERRAGGGGTRGECAQSRILQKPSPVQTCLL